jgi:hypothetical protein
VKAKVKTSQVIVITKYLEIAATPGKLVNETVRATVKTPTSPTFVVYKVSVEPEIVRKVLVGDNE